jgi:hypothetical protein
MSLAKLQPRQRDAGLVEAAAGIGYSFASGFGAFTADVGLSVTFYVLQQTESSRQQLTRAFLPKLTSLGRRLEATQLPLGGTSLVRLGRYRKLITRQTITRGLNKSRMQQPYHLLRVANCTRQRVSTSALVIAPHGCNSSLGIHGCCVQQFPRT